jgi:electron transfer flavoprotein beta subunit
MSLHIIVCIKSVVRSATRGVAKRTPENSELNPFDRPALEAALQIKAKKEATVTALTMGPPVSAEALAEAQAMGVDRAVLISDQALASSDTLVTAKVLAAAVEKIGAFDFLFFGPRSSDSDTGQVGPQTAAVLGVPFVSGVKRIDHEAGHWVMTRSMDAWEETWQVRPPAAVTIDARAFAPRPIGLVGISRVYDQPEMACYDLSDLNLSAREVGLAGSPTRVAKLEKIKRDRRCRLLEGEPQAQVDALLERLTRAGLIG